LQESKENSGGFQCVPGFHHYLKTWATHVPHYSDEGLVDCPTGDLLTQHGQKITMRRGSVLVWNSELPHCNYSNDSSDFRMCQYIRMFPAEVFGAPFGSPLWEARAYAVQQRLPSPDNFQVSELGAKLFGFEKWPE